MGCTQSKIENEEAVSRCKERKAHMADAVGARNAFAASHTAYTMALKNTGAALSDYGQGEAPDTLPTLPLAPPPREQLPPPPPLPPGMTPSSMNLLRSASMPADMALPKPTPKPAETIPEEDDAEDDSSGPNISAPVTPPPPPPPRPSASPVPPPPEPDNRASWDFFFDHNMHGAPLMVAAEDGHGQVEEGGRHQYGESVARKKAAEPPETPPETPQKVVEAPSPSPSPAMAAKPPKKPVQGNVASTGAGSSDGKRGKTVSANVSLVKILNDLDDHFLKASESAQEVSKMLEANRMHYHSNFADNRGHIDHSARVMRVITWNRSFKAMPNADEGKDDFDNEEWETHATILDKLLAWEKKLYDEVKAGELMKIEYQKKVALLNKQKKRNANPDTVEKTKAAVSHLHTRYIVDMQSMDSTVSEIQRLRDDQLHPKLVALVEGMAKMWESMHEHHVSQLKIVGDIKALHVSNVPRETTDQHHERTSQLCRIVNEWHANFRDLMSNQKAYVKALNSWLKLNIIPIESSLKEKVSSPPRPTNPPILALIHHWHECLEKLPTDIARNALSTFAAAIEAIFVHQQEEKKQKMLCEETRKDCAKKQRQFEDWHRKYMEKRTPPDDMVDPDKPEEANPHDPAAERKLVVDTVEKKLKDEVEAHQKLCIQVREKSLMSLKTHLPELFRAMVDFSRESSDKYHKLSSIARGVVDDDGGLA